VDEFARHQISLLDFKLRSQYFPISYNIYVRKFPPYITHIVGIDEAGRGPLAGPVAVGAFCIPVNFDRNFFIKVMDSKKLSEKNRELWFTKIRTIHKEGRVQYKVVLVSNSIIDTKGISYAIKLGIKKCLGQLGLNPKKTLILLDGSLKASGEFMFQKTIIKGDMKEPVIGCASIMAKVIRDKYMVRKAKLFPKYMFDVHKGYGTKIHRQALKKYGTSPFHRASFLKNFNLK